ncbi:MAG: mycothiol synthase [Acidimicrobiales bacterium]
MGSPDIERLDTTDASRRTEVVDFLQRCEAQDGEPPFDEGSRAALLGSPASIEGVVARSSAAVVGYGQLSPGRGAGLVEIAVARRAPEGADPATTRARLLGAIVSQAAQRDTPLRFWDRRHPSLDASMPSRLGFAFERDLLQMRLEIDAASRPPRSNTQVRPFVPGVDEDRWLEVNNRAFGDHPEQGHWDMGQLLDTEREPWFDPAGLLLLERGGRLAGSCWTKLHSQRSGSLGEIYVLAVDPDFWGLGVGRALLQAGLDVLSRSVGEAMLYVDAANRSATALYATAGFREHHTERCYLRAPDSS